MNDRPATSTGLTLLEKLDMISWNLTREAAAEIRQLHEIREALEETVEAQTARIRELESEF